MSYSKPPPPPFPPPVFPKLAENPKVLLESLPEALRRGHETNPVVNICIQAYAYGHISREELMEQLAVRLTEESELLRRDLVKFIRWFGAPPIEPIVSGT